MRLIKAQYIKAKMVFIHLGLVRTALKDAESYSESVEKEIERSGNSTGLVMFQVNNPVLIIESIE